MSFDPSAHPAFEPSFEPFGPLDSLDHLGHFGVMSFIFPVTATPHFTYGGDHSFSPDDFLVSMNHFQSSLITALRLLLCLA